MASTSVSNNLASTPPPPRRRAYSSITGSDRVFLRQDGENEGRMPILSSPSRAEGRRRPIRPRSASTSVILAFDGSQIPRFNENLASLIAGMASEEETEVQRRSHSAFSTPVRRRSNESYLDIQRERAHTCPRINGHYAATNAEDMGGEGRDEESGYQRIETYEESLENNAIIETPPERMTFPRTSPPFASRGGAQPDTSAMDSTRNDANLLPSVPQSTPIPARRAIVRIASPQRITTPGVRAGDNIIFRINPFVMKMMMMLSLYIILAYTWKTDLRSRYMSNEINYGLSEYWDGGIAQQRVARIGRDQGKLFNDDLGDGVVGDLPGVSSPTLSDIMRRPSLSHAHIPDSSHPVYEVQIRRVFESKWSFTRVCWYVIWLCFMLPVVEAFVAELKRYARGRHMYYQRLRNVRNYNAHDL